MARKKYIRRRIVKQKTFHDNFPSDFISQFVDILATNKNRYKYVRFGICTDLKAEYDCRKRSDLICWSSMKVYFHTDRPKYAKRFVQHFSIYENYINNKIEYPETLFDEHPTYFIYIVVGKRRKSIKQQSKDNYMMKKPEYKVLDLFCGCGGLSCGLDQVDGITTAVALDFEPKAINTFQRNFPTTKCICGSICDEDIKAEVIKASRDAGVNMIVGGPPCQGFSLKGKNLGLNDPRNFLFLEYVDIVDRLRPEVFIIENVKNLVASENHYFINQIYEKFEALGYHLNHAILNAYNYGVPQSRERTIIIGQLSGRIDTMPDNFAKTKTTVRDAISDLSYLNSGEGEEESEYITQAQSEYQKMLRGNCKILHNHKATNHSQVALDKLALIPPEGDKSSMPEELYGRQQFSTTWSRLIWDKPSPTIDTRFDTPSNGRNSHPYLNRSITPREAARIQSFPDSFVFYGNKCAICKQIGNAVPPLLAKAIGEHIVNKNTTYED